MIEPLLVRAAAAAVAVAVVVLTLAALPAVASDARCNITRYAEASVVREERWVSVEGVRRPVVVEWSGEAERAAAALLVSALRLAGYTSTSLRPRAPADLTLARRSHRIYNHSELVVLMAARWTPGDVWSGWLRALAVSPVPVAPRLHTRRPRRRPHTVPTTPQHTKLYVVKEWNWTQLAESTAIASAIRVDLVESVDRAELLKHIRREDNETFMFLDVEVWEGETNTDVEVVVEREGDDVAPRALCLADNNLWLHGPALWLLLSYFDPRRSELFHLLTLPKPPADLTVAVCEWAATSPRLLARLHIWANNLHKNPYDHYVYVFLCTPGTGTGTGLENDTIDEYVFLVNRTARELCLSSSEYCIQILEISYVNCDEDVRESATTDINELIQAEIFYLTVGAVGPGRVFDNVAPYAETKNLTLLSYSPGGADTVGAVGARAGDLARALRDLLAACSWHRLAILSEYECFASELSAALRASDDLDLIDVPLTYNRTDIRDALLYLKRSNARIFLLNAGARLAREVMLVAAELGLTSTADGRVWLTREWVGAGGGDAAPYELTFSWRGGDPGAAGFPRSPLLDELQARWAKRGSWPLYAAPLVDSLLALGKRYHQIFQNLPNLHWDVHSDKAFSAFWNLTETEDFSKGVVQELRFKNRGLRSPRVFLYRWSGRNVTLEGAWRVAAGVHIGVARCPLSAPPPDDGSVRCLVYIGARFHRYCGDKWLLPGILASIALVPVLVMAAVSARRAFRARDAHLVKRAEEMLEARWRAKASRLEPYFVERRALKLREQIGAGRFGRVWLGFLREPETANNAGAVAIAAKALREDAAPVEETEFFREARALAALQHEHVVRFVGVCVTDGPPLLLMEYAFFGDLLRYLRARRHLVASDSPEAVQVSAEALTRFARQAATALAYLARRGFVHRDVRAANCLVDERRTLKLADFGMARATRATDGAPDTDADGEYTSRRRALFPVLWMAPESLSRGVFSAASDVWALGVLALELVTLGARPYGSLSPLQVHHYVVREGRRPPLPRELAAESRATLAACWRRAPAARPPAAELAAWLATHPCALAPTAPRGSPDDCAEDVDSGIGEQPPPPPPTHSTSTDDDVFNDEDASFSEYFRP